LLRRHPSRWFPLPRACFPRIDCRNDLSVAKLRLAIIREARCRFCRENVTRNIGFARLNCTRAARGSLSFRRSQLQPRDCNARLPTWRKALFFRLKMPFRTCAGNGRCGCTARSQDSNSILISGDGNSSDTAIRKRESLTSRRPEAQRKLTRDDGPEAVLPNPH
jgi:hypothetical protein